MVLNDPSAVSKPTSHRRHTATLGKWLLRLSLGLILVGVLFAWQGRTVTLALQKASWPLVACAIAFYLGAQLLSAARWRLLLNAALRAKEVSAAPGEDATTPLSLLECYRIYLIGMFWNLWMPTAIGGDAMRAYLAGRRCGDIPLAASAIFMERLTGFIALVAIGVLGAANYAAWVLKATSSDPGAGFLRALFVGILAGLLCAGVLIALFVARRFAYRLDSNGEIKETSDFKGKIMRAWIQIHRALDLYLQPSPRGALIGAVAMSLIFQSSLIALNVLLAHAAGLALPLLILVWLVPALSLASMLPLGIGGLGVRETAAVALLSNAPTELVHADAGQIIAWSLLSQVTLWLSALPGAIAHALSRNEEKPKQK